MTMDSSDDSLARGSVDLLLEGGVGTVDTLPACSLDSFDSETSVKMLEAFLILKKD